MELDGQNKGIATSIAINMKIPLNSEGYTASK